MPAVELNLSSAAAVGGSALSARRAAVGSAAPRRTVLAVRAGRPSASDAGKLAGIASIAAAGPARADAVDDVVSAVTSGVKTAGSAAHTGITALESAGKYVKQAADAVSPVVKGAADVALPIAKDAASAISKAASPAVKSLTDSFPSAGSEVQKALSQQGINTKPVTEAGSKAIDTVKPATSSFVSWFLAQPLTTEIEFVLGASALLYFGPSLLGGALGLFQGYKDDITPAAALNILTTDRKSVLVDIRSTAEKEASGIPNLPSSASGREIELEYAFTEDRKLRGLIASPDAVEAKITALKIAALKRTKKGSPLILMDKSCSTAKKVAQELAKVGYSQVYVMAGGFDGRGGWVQSKLQINVARTVSNATIVPTAIASVVPTVTATPMSSRSGTQKGGTQKKLPMRAGKALPAPRK